MIGKGRIGNFEFDAQTIIDINSQKVFRCVAFSWAKRFTIPALGTIDFIFDPTGVSAGKTVVVLPVKFEAIKAGPINIDLRIDVTADEDGTLLPSFNRDNRAMVSTVAESVVRLGPTVTNTGPNPPAEFLLMSDGVGAAQAIGGQAKDDLILVADTTKKYLFRLENTENVDADAAFSMTIFEATEGL